MQKQGIPVVRETTIQKDSYIHRYMFGSMHFLGLVGWVWCDWFMIQNFQLTLRTAQVIRRARSTEILEGLRRFFCKLCQHIIKRTIIITVVEYGWNCIYSKENLHKLVVSKGSSNVWSKCADANFHTTFVVSVSAAKYLAPPLLILPGKRLNSYVL